MSNKNIFTILGIILILGVGGLVYSQKNTPSVPTQTAENIEEATNSMSETNEGDSSSDISKTTNTTTNTSSGLTAAAVATHNDASSCWAIINGNVYDLTSWIPNHPGGPQNILNLCGTDGTAKFTGKHGGNSKVLSILAGFKLGALEN